MAASREISGVMEDGGSICFGWLRRASDTFAEKVVTPTSKLPISERLSDIASQQRKRQHRPRFMRETRNCQDAAETTAERQMISSRPKETQACLLHTA